jgi:hypothetical protein
MLTIIIAMAVWAVLAYSDYKYLSISNKLYAASVIIMAALFALGFAISFKLAFVSLIVGVAIYLTLGWYIKGFMASADRILILLSFVAFPLPAIAGLALVALRGAWKGKNKYYPALTYFAIGFILISLIYVWI